uniref:G-protein coupled receptors family 1 profile domain-containing protein n=1 Tax=Branchiostoma floridae TaxID=7739 RepID=C3Y0H9_BRAFL|eukprot:XP_002610242.1 hypothetical protein BRAFLDRAFT_92961 [Branchiostoma floridae]
MTANDVTVNLATSSESHTMLISSISCTSSGCASPSQKWPLRCNSWPSKMVPPVASLLLLVLTTSCSPPATEACPHDCDCAAGSDRGTAVVCRGPAVTAVPSNIPNGTVTLEFHQTAIPSLTAGGMPTAALSNLTLIKFQEDTSLAQIEPGAFDGLTNLQYMSLVNCGLTSIPDFSRLMSAELTVEIDLEFNQITSVPTRAFSSLPENVHTVELEFNQIRSVASRAFSGSNIYNLYLQYNSQLTSLADDAFEGIRQLTRLDLSGTSITRLPTRGLQSLTVLTVKDTPTLKDFPAITNFFLLQEATLTYAAHCCAFNGGGERVTSQGTTLAERTRTIRDTGSGLGGTTSRRPSTEPVHTTQTDGVGWPGGGGWPGEGGWPGGGVVWPGEGGWLSPIPPVDQNVTGISCGEVVDLQEDFTCRPEPDDFNPCEDITGYVWLRVIIWFVSLPAVFGNLLVVLVLLLTKTKMNVAKFLICNLAFADFCLGFYLLMLAAADIYSSHSYYTWAIVWQTGGGCQVAGFLTMFGSVLSIFTLTFITVERWYAITYAIHLDKRVTMRLATRVMVLGWIAAIVMGLLPLVGVSSYSWTSICLPMDTTDPHDLGYVATTMIISVLAFGLICGCYIGMYLAVRHTDGAYGIEAKKNDAKVAKRMAILVFTDFACWFPIALFGITAAFGHPLIDVTNSKILLVIFYPINSCANPFLYAIFTKTFHRDCVTTLARFGFCQAKAMQYRGTVYSNTASVAGRHSQSTMSSVHKVSTKCNHSHASLKTQCASCSTPKSTRTMTKTSIPMTSLFKSPNSKKTQAVEINHTAIVNGTPKNANPDGKQTKDENDKDKAAIRKKLSIVNEASEGTSVAEDSTVGKEAKEEPIVLSEESRKKTDSSDTLSEGCSSSSSSSSRESISEKPPPIRVDGDDTITISLPKTWI